MSTEVIVLCRARTVLNDGDPVGFVWNATTRTGTYAGADVRLEELAVTLPDGTSLVAAVRFSSSHRGGERQALAVDALAARVARAHDGVVLDTLDPDPWLDAYRRARDEQMRVARRHSDEARSRVAGRPEPTTLDELRVAFAAVLLAAAEPADDAARDALAMLHAWGGVPPESIAFQARFGALALALARDNARVATGQRLQTVMAGYALDAALEAVSSTPSLRAELQAGGPLARVVATQWDAHDVRHAKQRAWLRKAWPQLAAELLQLPADANQFVLRRSSKTWPDALVDALLRASMPGASTAPFTEQLGFAPWAADEAAARVRAKRPTS